MREDTWSIGLSLNPGDYSHRNTGVEKEDKKVIHRMVKIIMHHKGKGREHK